MQVRRRGCWREVEWSPETFSTTRRQHHRHHLHAADVVGVETWVDRRLIARSSQRPLQPLHGTALSTHSSAIVDSRLRPRYGAALSWISLTTRHRNVRRILIGGSMPPCHLRRRKFRKFDYEMVHSEVYLNKYVVSIAPFSTPACPDCSQNIT